MTNSKPKTIIPVIRNFNFPSVRGELIEPKDGEIYIYLWQSFHIDLSTITRVDGVWQDAQGNLFFTYQLETGHEVQIKGEWGKAQFFEAWNDFIKEWIEVRNAYRSNL